MFQMSNILSTYLIFNVTTDLSLQDEVTVHKNLGMIEKNTVTVQTESMELSVVTKDVSAQFNYLIPSNGNVLKTNDLFCY